MSRPPSLQSAKPKSFPSPTLLAHSPPKPPPGLELEHATQGPEKAAAREPEAAEPEYPYRPPRVDAYLYQVDVPELRRRPPRRRESTDSVATLGAAAVEALGQPVWPGCGVAADESVTAFLRDRAAPLGLGRCSEDGGDEEDEELVLRALGEALPMGMAAEDALGFMCESVEFNVRARLGAGRDGLAFKRTNKQANSVPWLEWRRMGRLLLEKEPNPFLGEQLGERYAHLSGDKDDDESEESDEAGASERASNSAMSQDGDTGDRCPNPRRGAGKAELRRKWKAAAEAAKRLHEMVQEATADPSRNPKPSMAEVLDVLRGILALGPPDVTGSSNVSEDLWRCLKTLYVAVLDVRRWSAGVRDALCPGPLEAKPTMSAADVDRILQDSRVLPIHPPEVPLLQRLGDRAALWEEQVANLPLPFPEPFSEPTPEPSGVGVSDGAGDGVGDHAGDGASEGPGGVPLITMRRLLREAEKIPMSLRGEAGLRRRLQEYEALTEKHRDLINLPQGGGRARKGWHLRKVELAGLLGVRAQLRGTGVRSDQVEKVDSMVEAVHRWEAKVADVLDSSPGTRQIQAMLAEGRALPVVLQGRMDALEEKLRMAQEWVEKVRKAVPNRKLSSRSEPNPSDKLDLTDVKGLLAEVDEVGVELKEAGGLRGLLDTAEDWVGRVRGLIDAGDDADLANLETLLAEGSTIPVRIDEVDVLRHEISLRDWRARAAGALAPGGDTPPLTHLQELLRERASLRTAAPAAARTEGFRGPEQEEAGLKARIAEVDAWLVRHRRFFGKGATLRSIVDLEKLTALHAGGVALPCDLGEPLDHIQKYIDAAAGWGEKHKDLCDAYDEWLRLVDTGKFPPLSTSASRETSPAPAAASASAPATTAIPTPAAAPSLAPASSPVQAFASVPVPGSVPATTPATATPTATPLITASALTSTLGSAPTVAVAPCRPASEAITVAALESDLAAAPLAPAAGVADEVTAPERVDLQELIDAVNAADAIKVKMEAAERLRSGLGFAQAWLAEANVLCPSRNRRKRDSTTERKPPAEAVMAHMHAATGHFVDFRATVKRMREGVDEATTWAEAHRDVVREALMGLKARLVERKQLMAPETPDAPQRLETENRLDGKDQEGAIELKGLVNMAMNVPVRTATEVYCEYFVLLVEFIQNAQMILDAEGLHQVSAEHFAAFAAQLQSLSPRIPLPAPEYLRLPPDLEELRRIAARNSAANDVGDGATDAGVIIGRKRSRTRKKRYREDDDDDSVRAPTPESVEIRDETASVKSFEDAGAPPPSSRDLDVDAALLSADVDPLLRPVFEQTVDVALALFVPRVVKRAVTFNLAQKWTKRLKAAVDGKGRLPLSNAQTLLAEVASLDEAPLEATRLAADVVKTQGLLHEGAVVLAAAEGTGAGGVALESLENLVERCERARVRIPDAALLAKALTSSKQWLAAYARAQSNKSKVKAEDLEVLLLEGDALPIDVSQQAATLRSLTASACVCRRRQDGPVLKCDGCGAGFHLGCLALKPSAAQRRGGFKCVRCNTQVLLNAAAESLAAVLQKWRSALELAKSHHRERQRLMRRSNKVARSLTIQRALWADARRFFEGVRAGNLGLGLGLGLGLNQGGAATAGSLGGNLLRHPPQAAAPMAAPIMAPAAPMAAPAAAATALPTTSTTLPCVNYSGAVMDPSDALLSTESMPESPTQSPVSRVSEVPVAPGVAAPQPAGVDGYGIPMKLREDLRTWYGTSVVTESPAGLAAKMLAHYESSVARLQKEAAEADTLELRFREQETLETTHRPHLESYMRHVQELAQAPVEHYMSAAASRALVDLARRAQAEGVAGVPDVAAALGLLRVLQWGVAVQRQLCRKPSFRVLQQIVRDGHGLPMPDQKSLRFMENLLSRCVSWRDLYERTVQGDKYTPTSGPSPPSRSPGRWPDETPVDMIRMTTLLRERTRLPVSGRDVDRCQAAVEDGCVRYCICGRPNDGSYMIGCDSCDEWYHGACVGIPQDTNVENYQCIRCCQQNALAHPYMLPEKVDYFEEDQSDDEDPGDVEALRKRLRLDWPPAALRSANLESSDGLGEAKVSAPQRPKVVLPTSRAMGTSLLGFNGMTYLTPNPTAPAAGVANAKRPMPPTVATSASFSAPNFLVAPVAAPPAKRPRIDGAIMAKSDG